MLAAGAAELDEPLAERLPLQVAQEDRWRGVDRRASDLAEAGGMVTAVGAGTMAAAGVALLIDACNGGAFAGLAAVGALTGGTGMVIGPPMMLGGSLRGARSLRARGVMVTTLPGALGWTCLGLLVLSPAAQEGAIVLAPALYGASVGLGYAQMRAVANRRTEARLEPVKPSAVQVSVVPSPRGLALAGTF